MYLNEKCENFQKNNTNNNSANILNTLKIIIFLNIIFLNIPFNNEQIQEKETNTKNTSINSIKSNNINQILPNKKNYKGKLIIDNYLSSIPDKYSNEKNYEKEVLEKYYALKDIPRNSMVNSKLKKQIMEKIINFYKKNITKINKLIVTNNIAFGNTLLCLNNIIFYCEILGCKDIYLNSSNNWYIKNDIISNKTHISLIPSKKINCKGSKTLCIPFEGGLCLNPLIIKQKIRLNIIEKEIKRNLPKVNTNIDDLYIHIRCGNIFSNEINPSYAQPPFCFYQKILKQFKFKNIYLISGNNNNPVIKKLLQKFPKIIFKNNSLELDFAYLSNAYNLVGSVSSFLITSIKFNKNLRKYWEYDIYRKSEKFLHLHHDIYKLPKHFTIYKMKPSTKYKNEMFVWKNEKNQLNLMIKEKGINSKFIVEKE